MKKYYKVSEISGLYHIGRDSLRYYEDLGILNPERDENGYRMYSIQDMSRFNIIRDLRKLNVPMGRIKKYLNDRSIDTTVELFQGEKRQIDKKIAELEAEKRDLEKRLSNIALCQKKALDQIEVCWVPLRKCACLNETATQDAEVDLLIKCVQQRYEEKLYILGNTKIGAKVSAQSVKNGLYDKYNSIFFILEEDAEEYDFAFEAGKYLTVTFRGGYQKGKKWMAEMYRYAQKQGLKTVGQPIEIYCLDIHETSREEEFLTEVQMKILEA